MKKNTRLIGILLSILMICSLLGCGNAGVTPIAPDMSFDDFADDVFLHWVSGSTLNINFTIKDPARYGLSDKAATWGLDATDTGDDYLPQTLLAKLHGYDYATLSPSQQYTYDVLEYDLLTDIGKQPFSFYTELIVPLTGFHSNLPITLAEYFFERQADIDNYLTLCATLGEYFDEVILYEAERARQGLLTSDEVIQKVADECRDFAKSGQDNVLISAFSPKVQDLPFLSDAQKQQYIQKNRDTVLNTLLPAYEKLADDLEGLKGSSTAVYQNLSQLPSGKQYFRILMEQAGFSVTPEQAIKMMDDWLDALLPAMTTLVATNPNVISEMESYGFAYDSPMACIEYLQQHAKADFPPLPASSLITIKKVDPSLQDIVSPAFYFTPRVDDENTNIIYINEKSEQDMLYETLAHEGYPGHMMHFMHFYSKKPSDLAKLLTYNGSVEGWAQYIQSYCYKYEDISPALIQLMQLNTTGNAMLQARCELGVNYQNWDLAQCEKYMAKYGFDEETSQLLYEGAIERPFYAITYSLGQLEVLAIKEQYQTKMGDDYSEMAFHEAYLSAGPAPFIVIKKQLGLRLYDWLPMAA